MKSASSRQHGADWAAQRHRQGRRTAEADHQIGPGLGHPKPAGEVSPHLGHLDRLVDMRRADAQRGRLQGKTLEAAADPDPVLRVRRPADEDRNCARYLSFSPSLRKTRGNMRRPIHSGKTGLPEQAAKSPSPVATARDELKRIQSASSCTKVGSSICALLPATTKSRIASRSAGSVKIRTATPSTCAAASRRARSPTDTGCAS